MGRELLPRSNVWEFEHWLLRRVVEKQHHITWLKDDASTAWWQQGELNECIVVLAHYTDRNVADIRAAAHDYNTLKELIYSTSSEKKRVKKMVDEMYKKEEG